MSYKKIGLFIIFLFFLRASAQAIATSSSLTHLPKEMLIQIIYSMVDSTKKVSATLNDIYNFGATNKKHHAIIADLLHTEQFINHFVHIMSHNKDNNLFYVLAKMGTPSAVNRLHESLKSGFEKNRKSQYSWTVEDSIALKAKFQVKMSVISSFGGVSYYESYSSLLSRFPPLTQTMLVNFTYEKMNSSIYEHTGNVTDEDIELINEFRDLEKLITHTSNKERTIVLKIKALRNCVIL